VLRARAIACSGAAALHTDEEGEESLAAPWGAALTSLLHAAMASGAPERVPVDERAHLLRAWSAITPAR
jgi:hypothetical protein